MLLAGVAAFLAALLVPLFLSNARAVTQVWSLVLVTGVGIAFGVSMLQDR